MKKINLSSAMIIVAKRELEQALDSNKEFGITVAGEVKYSPFDPADIFIFQGKSGQTARPVLSLPVQELLGTNYQIIEEDANILIKAADAWQDIIGYNLHHCDYEDTAAEGVTQFKDEEIEDMGWMIIDFDVSYKELIEMLEEKADITLIYVDSKEPYRFGKMGYFNDIEGTRKLLFEFCRDIIKEKLANDPDYALYLLDEDQREAVEYFKLISEDDHIEP